MIMLLPVHLPTGLFQKGIGHQDVLAKYIIGIHAVVPVAVSKAILAFYGYHYPVQVTRA